MALLSNNATIKKHDKPPLLRPLYTLQEFMTGRTPKDPWPVEVFKQRPSYFKTKPTRTSFPEAP